MRIIAATNHDFRKEALGVTPAVLQVLPRYHWPGNVRELKNLVERVMILGDGRQVEIEDLPVELLGEPSVTPNASDGFTRLDGGFGLEALEGGLLMQARERAGGNRT